ncbi:MAG: ABC transporter substrate-binding protein, partial [Bacteroidia bacterium]
SSDFKLVKSPFLNTEYLAFNLEDSTSPVRDINFRKAIHHCIDREAMILYLRNGVGIPADGGFTPRGLPSYRRSSRPPFDKELAQEYLSKSVIQQTQPLKLTTTATYLDLCILVQKNCADIGIEIKIDVIPSSLLKQQKSSGDLAFFRSSWIADYPDGENYMACFYGLNKAPNGPNYTRLDNKEFDSKYEELLSTTEPFRRSQIFTDLEKILELNQPYALLFYDESIWIKSKEINGVKVNALNHLDLREVSK